MKPRKRPERIAFRVQRGALVPADDLSRRRLRARNLKLDSVVFAELKQPRNPGFHRLAHVFGEMVAGNIEAFDGMDCHHVLKRLQVESGVGCEEIAVVLQGLPALYRIPLSLSFESMDEGEFQAVFRGLCAHVAKVYWPSLTPEQVQTMAETMPEVA